MLTLSRSRRRRRAGLFALAAVGALAMMAVGAAPARADGVRDAQMWVLDAINAPAAWRVTQGQGVTVAVIDSGVDPQVSDLVGSVTTGPDYTGVNTPGSNSEWGVHGTWMASLIAGHGHDGGDSGILGIAPKAHILSIRVITDSQDPNAVRYEHESQTQIQNELAEAIIYSVSHGASVISMSLGYGMPSLPVRSALQEALNHGVVVIASSGNSGDDASAASQGHAPYSFPADYPGVMGVAALSQGGAPAGFSSDNLSVQVAAPGVDVPAQGRDGEYWLVSGTSPACALTAGVAALIKSAYPALPPDLVRQAITTSTTNRPAGGYDEQVGFGTVDAAAALATAAQLSAHGLVGPGAPVPLSNSATSTSQSASSPAASHSSSTHGDSTITPASNTSPLTAGVTAASHFGGGVAAVPPPPVASRGLRPLVLFCALAAACLAVIATTMTRLIAGRRLSAQNSGGPDGWSLATGRAGIAGFDPGRAGPEGVAAERTDGSGQSPAAPGADGGAGGANMQARRIPGLGVLSAPRFPWSGSSPGRHALPSKKPGARPPE
jgi:subtilisin family serine protease